MKYIILAYFVFLIILLTRCSSPTKPSCIPVDVRVQDGYCFIPIASNMDIMQRQCGFEFYDDCRWIADPNDDRMVYGTCERQYIYVRECADE